MGGGVPPSHPDFAVTAPKRKSGGAGSPGSRKRSREAATFRLLLGLARPVNSALGPHV